MSNITKVPISPVVPTEIRHHRELPVGEYRVLLEGFGEKTYLLIRLDTKEMYLVTWLAEIPLFREFQVREDGSLGYMDPGRPEDHYPG